MEVPTWNVLRDEVGTLLRLVANVVHPDDVGMSQARHRLRFATKSSDVVGIEDVRLEEGERAVPS